jgi:hypothetical protein
MLKAGNTVKIRQPAHRHGIWYFYVVSYYPKMKLSFLNRFPMLNYDFPGNLFRLKCTVDKEKGNLHGRDCLIYNLIMKSE